MRFLLIVLALVPTTCFGLGAESVEYIGLFADGSNITMQYVSEGDFTKWTGNNLVYGSTSRPNLRYCWPNEKSIKQVDPYGERIHTHFVCAQKIDGPPVVFFKKEVKHGVAFKKALTLYRRTGNCEGTLGNYYSCEKGCNDSTPTLVFQVLHWEHACE